MTLENLQQAMIEAMRSGEKERKVTISNYIAQIKKSAIDKGCRDNIDETFVDAELVKIRKSVVEQIDTCPVSRPDLLEKYEAELIVLNEFAPKPATTDTAVIYMALLNHCAQYHLEITAQNRGAIMKSFDPNWKRVYDMATTHKVLTAMIKGEM